MNKASKNRLTPKQLPLFTGTTLFDKVARAVCRAGTLPRKELYESWEVARRVRRRYRGGRVVDIAGGHGLLAHLMLLLDDSSAAAEVIDPNIPDNAAILSDTIIEAWPRLRDRIHYHQSSLEEFSLSADDLVVSVHACGFLTDDVLQKAVTVGARVAVLPCCHHLDGAATGGLEGWVDGPLAVDLMRAERLRLAGYTITTSTILADITPKNRLLMANPNPLQTTGTIHG
ncbi:MAG: methyltransferase [Deltaproteobacteria bacterium]|nr:methyltransferase [Candidatus Anaeroferrophillus wilburensis]MBN2888961.1 methyltransferase [Deltaproteobacteria bacterium]